MLTKDQYEQLEEYLETILELYTAEEYEEFVENIVYNYCKNRFGISDRKTCVDAFYTIVNKTDR